MQRLRHPLRNRPHPGAPPEPDGKHQRRRVPDDGDNLATGTANRAYFDKTGERKFLVGADLHAVMLGNQQGGTVRVGRRITIIRSRVTGDGGVCWLK